MRKIIIALVCIVSNYCMVAAQTVPSPKSHFGFAIGDNYQLASFTQTEAYLKKVAAVSKKVKLQVIGQTEEGRNQYMMIVSDPSNLANLEKYKTIAQKLAHAENISIEEAKRMSKEGKAVVWIDGGLHATEVVGIHQWISSEVAINKPKEQKSIVIILHLIIYESKHLKRKNK